MSDDDSLGLLLHPWLESIAPHISDKLSHEWADHYLPELVSLLRMNGVVVLPPDHPLRTGEPDDTMVREAISCYEILDMRYLMPQEAMRQALRAALTVLREI